MITTRPLQERDIGPALDLMRLSLGESPLLERSAELFRWKHKHNPFGESISLVAESGDTLIGLRTFMRWNLSTKDGELIRCVRAVDTATHPEFQRLGVFKRLTEEALELARDDRVDLVFNTPNDKSKPGYLKMGWQEVGAIDALVRPSLAMTSSSSGDGLPDPETFLDSTEPVPSDLADRDPMGLRTPKSLDYIQWRFGSHPTARYFAVSENSSTAILRPNIRRGRRELIVADLFGDPRVGIKMAAKRAKSAYLATWFTPGSPERAAAVRRGFIPIPRYKALTLVMRPLRDLPSEWGSIQAWDAAVSDFELL